MLPFAMALSVRENITGTFQLPNHFTDGTRLDSKFFCKNTLCHIAVLRKYLQDASLPAAAFHTKPAHMMQFTQQRIQFSVCV